MLAMGYGSTSHPNLLGSFGCTMKFQSNWSERANVGESSASFRTATNGNLLQWHNNQMQVPPVPGSPFFPLISTNMGAEAC